MQIVLVTLAMANNIIIVECGFQVIRQPGDWKIYLDEWDNYYKLILFRSKYASKLNIFLTSVNLDSLACLSSLKIALFASL